MSNGGFYAQSSGVVLRPASEVAKGFGVKALIHGGPGVGKTPVLLTAPQVVICAIEPGLLSIRNSNVPVCVADTPARIEDFHRWVMQSAEARQFKTIAFDSGSEMAETFLREELAKKSSSGKKVDGKAAYGEMGRRTLAVLRDMYYLRGPHVVVLCKQQAKDGDLRKPYFPGDMLNIAIPHLYDEILSCEYIQRADTVGVVRAFRTLTDGLTRARDRSGVLDEFEPANLAHIFNKIETLIPK